MTFTPGYGTDQLHLGQSAEDLLVRFGNAERRRKAGAFREYWIYPKRSFECLVSRRSDRVLSIFFHRQKGHQDKQPFGLTEEDVRHAYSVPAKEGGGFQLAGAGFIGRWFSYDSGVGFHFDVSGHVETVSIFAPKRKNAKAIVSHNRSQGRQVAALRRA